MNPLIHGLTDNALEGAIRDLTRSRLWAERLQQLLAEKRRRKLS